MSTRLSRIVILYRNTVAEWLERLRVKIGSVTATSPTTITMAMGQALPSYRSYAQNILF